MVQQNDFAEQHVGDICVVPNRFCRQHCRPHNQTVDGVVVQQVHAHQRAVVVDKLAERINLSRRPPPIAEQGCLQCVGVDGDRRPGIVPQRVVHQDRLRTADEDRGCLIPAAAVAIGTRLASFVVGQQAVGHPHFRLMNFDGGKLVESAFDRRQATRESDQRVIQTPLGNRIKEQTTPLTRLGIRRIQVIIGVETPTAAKSIVLDGRQNDWLLDSPFDDQLRAHFGFDARSLELHDHARVDTQSRVEPRAKLPVAVFNVGPPGVLPINRFSDTTWTTSMSSQRAGTLKRSSASPN